MTKSGQQILIKFAKMFEAVHQEICKKGGAQIHEYMEIWHVYKNEVREIVIHLDESDSNIATFQDSTKMPDHAQSTIIGNKEHP